MGLVVFFWPFFGLPFCLSCDGFNHRFLFNFLSSIMRFMTKRFIILDVLVHMAQLFDCIQLASTSNGIFY
jgi:hypothetical protein